MIGPGTEISDKYKILRLIGEGAMGSVYEAEQAVLRRRVAVKVLHGKYGINDQVVARFEREARAAASCGHEHIVDVLDFGGHDGLPYLVMEYLRGQTLADLLASEGSLESTRACKIAGQVLSALGAVHARGIVHRDLKPANIFLSSRDDAPDFVKLLDFGISKMHESGSADRVITRDGAFLGTPGFMAPEQWMGRADIDHRADLFSVGVLLYQMLTGSEPYEGETQGELFLQIVNGTSEPPAPSEIAPELPGELDGVVLRAVRRDRSARFSSAREFLEALRPLGAAGISVVPDPPIVPVLDPPRALPAIPRTVERTQVDTATSLRPRRRATALALVAVGALALAGLLPLERYVAARQSRTPAVERPARSVIASHSSVATPVAPPTGSPSATATRPTHVTTTPNTPPPPTIGAVAAGVQPTGLLARPPARRAGMASVRRRSVTSPPTTPVAGGTSGSGHMNVVDDF